MLKPYSQIQPKINFLVKPSKEKSISKTMKFLFIFLFLTLSLNFGVTKHKSKIVIFCAKTFCVFQSLAMVFILISVFIIKLQDTVLIFWYSLYVLEYFILVFTLLFSKKTSFVDFYKDILAIDAELSIESHGSEFIIIIGVMLSVALRILLSLIYCIFFPDYCIALLSFHALVIFDVLLVCTDVFLIVYFTIYFSIYCRVKKFTRQVKNGNSTIVRSHFLYKSIADVYDRIKVVYNPLFVVPLVFHTIDMMITIFYPLLEKEGKMRSPLNIITANMSVFMVFALLFAPAFASGLLASQAEKLRLVLLDKLLQEREQKQSKDIERFIRYIEARPMKTIICKVIPLDWKLPVSVLNICVTYLIVMLQFTHKY